LQKAHTFLQAVVLKNRLRRARIGFAGHRVPGMTETAPNEFSLKKAIGPIVMPLDLPILLERSQQMPESEAVERWQDLVHKAGSCQVSEGDGVYAMKVYAALYEMIQEYGLDAVTVGCYPHLMGKVCMSIALLADQGIPLACEGDVNGAVAQLMLTLLTASPTHNTDWLDPLPDKTVVFSHCGSGSFSLAEKQSDIQLTAVRLMDQGVCAIFPAKPGSVTLVNLMARSDGYQLALLEGEAVRTDMVFPGNPVRVRFSQPLAHVMEWIFTEGIGHHWMIGYGHVGEELRAWANIVGDGIHLKCLK
jgi:L-fucose isomerase-like protein